MPASFFQPIGEEMLQYYNDIFDCNWPVEWAGYSLAYLVFVCSVSLYNFGHPKFLRTAPDALQVRFELSHFLVLKKYILFYRCRLLTEYCECSHDLPFCQTTHSSGL